MASERHVQRRRVLSSLLGGLVVGSGCVERSNSGSSGTTGRETSTTASLTTATTESTTETTTSTTTETTTTETTETTTETTTPRPLSYENLELRNRPMLGDRNAPATMVYWGDYRCPYCQRFELKTLPKIKTKLIGEGDLSFVYKPVSIFGKKSERVARAGHCVWNQVKNDDREAFWNWQERAVTAGAKHQEGWTKRGGLAELAKRTEGVAAAELVSCLQNGDYGDRVSADLAEAKDWGLEGTPHFLIFGDGPEDGTRYTGTPSYDWVADTVRRQLLR